MDPNGDISDTFDDADDLVRSVENGRDGLWNDDSAVFEDPKVKELREKMEAANGQSDYQARRLRELQERGLKQAHEQNPPPEPQTNPDAEAGQGEQWGESTAWQGDNPQVTTAWGDRRMPGNSAQPGGKNSPIVHARRATDRVEPPPMDSADEEDAETVARIGQTATYLPSILAAMLMFTAVAIVHGVIDSWSVTLAARAGGAMLITGILWQKFQSSRLRAMAIGTITYVSLFAPSARIGEPENLFALLLGLMVVVAGSGLIGVQRNEFSAQNL